ncbi:MAG: radical SAM protein [Candidatus Abyssobacteria bacterium SURF_5]|uniref:Radical SAM protein n=1 Tax=Abyssobacteria bacterium (strain SURF_5) TaxID=2093360 RepID=A0A3A4N6M7_ABYX5|nr:MAG: radical SAM protein [Candidatus Abyssubacteria bacterium SURF_5]
MSALHDYITLIQKRELFQVIYHVTRRCNARCRSCFSWKRTLTDDPELNLIELEKIIHSMPPFPWLLLSGGEPFLREDLPETVSLFYRNSDIRHITLPTNALLPERIESMIKKICSTASEATVNLVLSIDGIGAEHDRMRGTPNNFDSLMETWGRVSPLRDELPNLSIKFHTVLSSDNYLHFDEIRDHVKKLRPDLHTFDFIRGKPADASLALPPDEELVPLIRKIKEVLRFYGGFERLRKHHSLMKSVYDIIMQGYYDEFLRIRRERRQVIPCVADSMTLVLGASGEASLCEMLEPFGLFREFDYDYGRLCASKASKEARQRVSSGKCYCYHSCYQTLNVLFRPASVVRTLARRVAAG